MKCPKCGYIGFEHTERCRNCGYDFALAVDPPAEPDLSLSDDQAGPLGDFELGGYARKPAAGAAARRRAEADLDVRMTPPSRGPAGDLPLFGESAAEDLPLVPSASPTPPLAVRRSTPPAARARPRPNPRAVDSALDAVLPLAADPGADTPRAIEAQDPGAEAGPVVSGNLARLLAALVDWTVLLGLDLTVIYFTLRICRLSPAEVVLLPFAPLLAFLALLNGGYLSLLTAAGGQTLGKMAFGLKVVGPDERPPAIGRSIVRAVALLVGALPLGLGLLPAAFGREHRGLHDLAAGTRVVRMAAS